MKRLFASQSVVRVLEFGLWDAESHGSQIGTVTIACNGEQVQLSWRPTDANLGYEICRVTTPYVAPILANQQARVTGSSWTAPTAGICGVSATALNTYYVVRATCVGAHNDAGEVAEFDFGLTPGG